MLEKKKERWLAILGLTALLSGGSVVFAQETEPVAPPAIEHEQPPQSEQLSQGEQPLPSEPQPEPVEPILTGWVQDETTQKWSYYLQDGTVVKSTWKKINDRFFYFDQDGHMVSDAWVMGYYLGKSGAMATNQWVWDAANRVWYYTLEDGRYARESWVQIKDQWFHFRRGGAMDRSRWIGEFYLNADGAMATNQWVWDAANRVWYYTLEDGRYARASWLKLDHHWYHFQIYGQMDRDTWIDEFYVQSDGKMVVSQWLWSVPDEEWFYAGEDGRYYREKWLQLDGKYYYFVRYGNMARSQWIGDYYVGSDGVMVTGQTIEGRYYVDETGRYRKSAYIWTPFYSQIPDAVSGCEAYSLTQGLHAIGKATWVSPYTMTTYVPQSPNGDPRNGFAGSQYSVYSLGGLVSTIYPAPLTPLAQYYAPNSEDTTGYSVDQLKAELLKGNTVVVWATSGYFSDPYMVHQWFGWEPTNPHIVTLNGFDDDTMYVTDPIYGKFTVSLSQFSYVYNTRGKMSITLRK